MNCIPAGLYL